MQMVESQRWVSVDRFDSNVTASSTSSIRMKNTFIEVLDDAERINLDRIRSKRSNSLPPTAAAPAVDLASFLLGHIDQLADRSSPNQVPTGMLGRTTLVVDNLVQVANRGHVFWQASCRGFDIGLINNVEFDDDHSDAVGIRSVINFVDHASAVSFTLLFDNTVAEDGSAVVRVTWSDRDRPPVHTSTNTGSPPLIENLLSGSGTAAACCKSSKKVVAKPATLDQQKSRLFVGGLAPETTDDSLFSYFCGYGELVEASVILDKRSKMSRGFGFIAFKDGYVPPAVLAHDHLIAGKTVGVRVYGSAPSKKEHDI